MVFHKVRDGLLNRYVYKLPGTRSLSIKKRAHSRHKCRLSGNELGNGHARFQRLALRLPTYVHGPAQRIDDNFLALEFAVRAFLSKEADRSHDQSGI